MEQFLATLDVDGRRLQRRQTALFRFGQPNEGADLPAQNACRAMHLSIQAQNGSWFEDCAMVGQLAKHCRNLRPDADR